jgi:hypothetical protein
MDGEVVNCVGLKLEKFSCEVFSEAGERTVSSYS